MIKIEKSRLQPPASDVLFRENIKHPDVYIWDAWSSRKDGLIFLYTLASPRSVYEDGNIDIQTQRDFIPHHHRLFISADEGKTWQDHGAVFGPRPGEDAFDSRSVWTGGITPWKNGFIGGYTGIRQLDEEHPFLQSLGLFHSEDGLSYHRLINESFSCPLRDYDDIISKGYYLGPKDDLGASAGEEGNCILAWRDPSFAFDQDNKLHVFWGAKTGTGSHQKPALGHGILSNIDATPQFQLLAPVILPDSSEFTQAEVPQVLYHPLHKKYYLVVSTTDRITNDQLDGDLDLCSRLYMSTSLDGPWESCGKLIKKEDKRYPAVLVGFDEGSQGDGLLFTAPYNRGNDESLMHTMPRLNRAVIKNGKIDEIS